MRDQGPSTDVGTRNVEVVRASYAAVNRRDLDTLFSSFHDDVEFHDHGTGFRQSGRQQYRKWLEDYFRSWESYRETPVELTPVDDRVVTCVRSEGVGKRSHAKFEDQHGEIHTVRNGRIVSVAIYPTYALALEAADLA